MMGNHLTKNPLSLLLISIRLTWEAVCRTINSNIFEMKKYINLHVISKTIEMTISILEKPG
jgi:hypothetical protein